MITKQHAMERIEKKENQLVVSLEQAIDSAILSNFDGGFININPIGRERFPEVVKSRISAKYSAGGWEIEFVNIPGQVTERIRLS